MKAKNQDHIIQAINGGHLEKYKGRNPIYDVFDYVDSLDASSLLQAAEHCSDARGLGVFFMGGLLFMLRHEKYYEELGFTSFQQLLDEHLGIKKSTAYDWISIYDNLIESEVQWSDISHLGWTKIRLFAACLTKENHTYWIKIANEKNASELRDFVREQKKLAADKEAQAGPAFVSNESSTHVDVGSDSTDSVEMPVTESTKAPGCKKEAEPQPPMVSPAVAATVRKNYIFPLAPDQRAVVDDALRLMKVESETEHESVALTNICEYFLATYDPREFDSV